MQEEVKLNLRQVRRRRRRRFIGAGVLLIGLGCLAFLIAFILTRLTPAWWDSAIDVDDHSIERARGFESALVTELNRVRDGTRADPRSAWKSQPWAVAMKSGDINAWIEHSAPKWLASRQTDGPWPREIVQVRVGFDNDVWRLGMQVESGSRAQFLSVEAIPHFEPDGTLWLTTQSVGVGRLRLPASFVLRRAPELLEHYLPPALRVDPRSTHLLDVLRGTSPIALEPSIRLADGRRVRILEFHSRENRLEIVARTEKR